MQAANVPQNKNQVKRLDCPLMDLDMSVSQCNKAGPWEWLALFDPKLYPVQLASPVAFIITIPPFISPSKTPSTHFLPLPSLPSAPAYHISYKGPNKYPLYALLTITIATSVEKKDTHPSLLPLENLTENNINMLLCMFSVCLRLQLI